MRHQRKNKQTKASLPSSPRYTALAPTLFIPPLYTVICFPIIRYLWGSALPSLSLSPFLTPPRSYKIPLSRSPSGLLIFIQSLKPRRYRPLEHGERAHTHTRACDQSKRNFARVTRGACCDDDFLCSSPPVTPFYIYLCVLYVHGVFPEWKRPANQRLCTRVSCKYEDRFSRPAYRAGHATRWWVDGFVRAPLTLYTARPLCTHSIFHTRRVTPRWYYTDDMATTSTHTHVSPIRSSARSIARSPVRIWIFGVIMVCSSGGRRCVRASRAYATNVKENIARVEGNARCGQLSRRRVTENFQQFFRSFPRHRPRRGARFNGF